MNPYEHYQEAERLIEQAWKNREELNGRTYQADALAVQQNFIDQKIAIAQVHATLALVNEETL